MSTMIVGMGTTKVPARTTADLHQPGDHCVGPLASRRRALSGEQ
jgi:hypothetical protein